MENKPQTTGSGKKWRVEKNDEGTRLDALLAREFQLSRMAVRRLLDRGCVRHNQRIENEKSKGLILTAGDVIEVTDPVAPNVSAVVPDENVKLTILAQGPGWIAIDKPAGMPVHPLDVGETGTVLNALIAKFPQIQGVGEGGLRSGVVHRLDVTTTGVLIFATQQNTWQRLRQAFTEHRTHKLYHALALGKMSGQGREEVWLHIAQHKPAKVKVVEKIDAAQPGARKCDLHWKVLENMAKTSLLEIKLGTGFLHQIRVTLAHLNHAVIGDELYAGDLHTNIAASRPMLHAVEFTLDEIHARAPYPEDFSHCLEICRR